MKSFLFDLFGWWNGPTLGTKLHLWRKGVFVGEDEFGNKYYTERNGKRRWVALRDVNEASMIPPGWNGWMHHRVHETPEQENYHPKDWEQAHLPNKTGTKDAYRPKGSLLAPSTSRDKVTGDYEPWQPN